MGANVSRSLRELPEKFRGIVWFADVEEFTYREIAEQFDIPIGTVMSCQHRGRAMLRRNYYTFTVKDDQSKENNNLSIGS